MFLIKIADIIVEIDNKYDFVKRICKKYIVENMTADISVCASDEEISKEQSLTGFDNEICESSCIYRQICMKAVHYNIFIMHASVISVDNKAYGFLAKSGVGKSTHTRLWMEYFGEKAIVVNGDKPLIRKIDGDFYAYGTPWCGKEGLENPIKVKIETLYFLQRNEKNYIEKPDKFFVVKNLFNQILVPKTENSQVKFIGMIDEMIKKVPFYILNCNISHEAVKVAYEANTQ